MVEPLGLVVEMQARLPAEAGENKATAPKAMVCREQAAEEAAVRAVEETVAVVKGAEAVEMALEEMAEAKVEEQMEEAGVCEVRLLEELVVVEVLRAWVGVDQVTGRLVEAAWEAEVPVMEVLVSVAAAVVERVAAERAVGCSAVEVRAVEAEPEAQQVVMMVAVEREPALRAAGVLAVVVRAAAGTVVVDWGVEALAGRRLVVVLAKAAAHVARWQVLLEALKEVGLGVEVAPVVVGLAVVEMAEAAPVVVVKVEVVLEAMVAEDAVG